MLEIIVRTREECEEEELVTLIDLAARGNEVDLELLESGIRQRARHL